MTEPGVDGPEVDGNDYLAFVDTAVDRVADRWPDVDQESMRIVMLLGRVSSALVYDIESAVHRPSGWTWAGFRLLFALWITGPLDAKRAAQLTGMSRAAISSLVRTLEKERLITRTADPNDGRSIQLALTDRGRSELTAAYRLHNTREREWIDTLSDDEKAALLKVLHRLVETARAPWVKHRD